MGLSVTADTGAAGMKTNRAGLRPPATGASIQQLSKRFFVVAKQVVGVTVAAVFHDAGAGDIDVAHGTDRRRKDIRVEDRIVCPVQQRRMAGIQHQEVGAATGPEAAGRPTERPHAAIDSGAIETRADMRRRCRKDAAPPLR